MGTTDRPPISIAACGCNGGPCWRIFHLPCDIVPKRLDPEFAFHSECQQYHSSEILHRIETNLSADSWHMLGVASIDLHTPILTFVLGQTQMVGPCAVVSAVRRRQKFYGLPEDKEILRERLLKEAVHDLGHTLNLTHCDDYGCALALSHAVEMD